MKGKRKHVYRVSLLTVICSPNRRDTISSHQLILRMSIRWPSKGPEKRAGTENDLVYISVV